jgi:hypothetical protein
MGTTTTLGRAQRVETRTACEENCIVRANGWRQCYQAPAASRFDRAAEDLARGTDLLASGGSR